MVLDVLEMAYPQASIKRIKTPITSNVRVLIADANPDVCRTLQNFLEMRNHDIKVTRIAHEVISVARRWLPNVILIGSEFCHNVSEQVCQELLNDTRTSHIPMMVLLDSDSKTTRLHFLEIGVSDAISKPFDLEEVSLRLESLVHSSTR
jgi:DNA-binding response OmpR family regulator